MRKKQSKGPVELLFEKQPELREGGKSVSLLSNLDLTEPCKRTERICICTEKELLTYENGEKTECIPLEKISSFHSYAGVGSVFSEYRTVDGEDVLFARGDGKQQSDFFAFAKSANRRLHLNQQFGERRPQIAQKPSKASAKNQFLRFLLTSKSEYKYLLLSVFMFFISTVLEMLTPYLDRIMVDDYIQAENLSMTKSFLLGFAGFVITVFLLKVLGRVVSGLRGTFASIAGCHLSIIMRDLTFQKVQRLSMRKFSHRSTGDLMKRVSGDTQTVKIFMVDTLPSMIEQIFRLIAVVIVLFTYDPLLALVILLPAPFIRIAYRVFHRKVHSLYRQRTERNARSNAVLHDIFSGIRVVKSYGMERAEEEHFTEMANDERKSQLRLERFWAVFSPVLNFFSALGGYALLYYVGKQMLGGSMSAGELSQFTTYSFMLYAPLEHLLRFPRDVMTMKASLNRVYEIIDEPEDMMDPLHFERLPDFAGEITLDHVGFSYEEGDDVLKDVSLSIKPGEFVGIVGKSGVGKSTLINLVMRMYDVGEGSIKIDGVDVRDIPQEELRKEMGVVLQETYLFSGTVWQNLSYAKPEATREEVIRAAKIAGAHEFIIRLPDGYQTYVGEKGYTLSGGERQRIAIARALLHDPKILILDEATSALDTETEKWIQDALKELCKGRTTIAIAHRLSTLRNANKLVVLDHGKVAEVGSHEELMQKNGIYASLVLAQREMTKM